MLEELKGYDDDVAHAYAFLLGSVRGIKHAKPDPEEFRKRMKKVTGMTGAMCGSAKKRVLRQVVIKALQKAKDNGLDITPTAAMHVCERLLGRGIDNRQTLEFFSTPGRTAADKTRLTAEDLAELEESLHKRLAGLCIAMVEIKDGHRQDYKTQLMQ